MQFVEIVYFVEISGWVGGWWGGRGSTVGAGSKSSEE